MELDEMAKNSDHVEKLKKINILNNGKETYWCVPPKTVNYHIQSVKVVDGKLKFLVLTTE